MKNKIIHILAIVLLALTYCTISLAQTLPEGRGQAWRIYKGESSCAEYVSFPLSNPGKITVEAALPGHTLLGAVRAKDAYYLMDSDDGAVPARFLRYDTERNRLDTIRTYRLADAETVFIFLDMAYDAENDDTYVLAFDIAAATEAEDGSIESPQGLYRLNTKTGSTTLIGLQDEIYFIGIAIDDYGRMLGLTSEGRVWTIDKNNFTPYLELTDDNYEQPSNLQSLAYDPASESLYWAGFSEADMGFLGVFSLNDTPLTYKRIGLLADNSELIGLSIDTSPLPRTSPSAPTEFTANAGERGAKTAQLTWHMPTANLDGGSLLGKLKAHIYANGELLATIPELQPGAEANWSGECPEGNVEFCIRAKDLMHEGRAAYADSIFVGTDIPGCPEYLEAVRAESGDAITLTWEEPATGMHGGWYDAAAMTYTVVRYPDATTIAEGLHECTFTDETISEPHAYYYRVYAQTDEGRGPAAESPTIIAGGALTLPFSCNFSTDELIRFWTVLDADADGHCWGHAQNYQSAEYSYMRYFPDERLAPDGAADDWLISPPLRMEAGHHYRVSYKVRTQGPLFPITYDITVGRDTEPEAQSDVIGGAYMDTNGDSFSFEPKSHFFSVSENGTWHIGFHMRNRVSMHITDVKIEEVFPQDIAVESITCANICSVGKAEDFVFTVRNAGIDDISSYRLILTGGDGTVLAAKDISTPLAVGETRTDTLQWTCTVAGDMLIGGHAELLNDCNFDNNEVAPRSVSFSSTAAWYDFLQGRSYTRTSPFCLEKAYGFSQSIYTREWMEAPQGRISAIRYYYNSSVVRDVTPFHVRLLLANTDQEGYEYRDAQPLAAGTFQEVFDGEVALTEKEGFITITFDKPFTYDGNGLAVMVYSNSDKSGEYINWICYYRGSDDIMHTIYTNGAREFTYTDDVEASPELPHASFFWTDITGIHDNPQWSVLNPQSSIIYDLQGRRINGQSSMVNGQSSMVNGQSSMVNGQSSMVNGQSSMVNGQLPKGIYIQNGRKILK